MVSGFNEIAKMSTVKREGLQENKGGDEGTRGGRVGRRRDENKEGGGMRTTKEGCDCSGGVGELCY